MRRRSGTFFLTAPGEPGLLGKHHPLLRRLRALRRDPERRREEGVLVAEGPHLAEEALASGAAVDLALVGASLGERAEGRRLLERLAAAGVPVETVAESVLEGLSDARSPQPVLLVVRLPRSALRDVLAGAAPLVVVAHGIQDPGNLGALVRTAAAAGASGLVSCGTGADLHHPRAVRASAGAIFRLPAATADAGEVVLALGERRVRLVAADPRGETLYSDADLRPPLALLLGGEGAGLPESLRAVAALRVRIPLHRAVESLSVGAAAAVLLFEAARATSDRDGRGRNGQRTSES